MDPDLSGDDNSWSRYSNRRGPTRRVNGGATPPTSSATPPSNANTQTLVGLSDPSISQARRRKLDAINRLHSVGAQLDIDIPQIVVIGSQSAGKSSLIESISGITLPRASGTCTRCPTECRLVQSTESWQCLVFLRFMTDESGQALDPVKNLQFGQPIKEPKDVEDRLRRAQRAILNPAVDSLRFLENNHNTSIPRNALNFSTNYVSLEIRGPDLTDLSFCDLPGLIASVGDGGRDEDVEEVKQLVSSYISKPSCIILLAVACETDFETQGAYRLAKQFDKNGTRTIGVLTKPDRIPDGEESRWVSLIKNETSALQNGWYCVKQPSSKELESGLTFQEARRRGEEFFKDRPWSALEAKHQKRLGTRAVTQKLNEFLMSVISKRLPEIMQELQALLQQTKEELRTLPKPASKDPLMEVMHLIGDFSDALHKHAEGFNHDLTPRNAEGESHANNQFLPIAEAHETFRRKIRATVPDFRPFEKAIERPRAPGTKTSSAHVVEPKFLLSEEEDHVGSSQETDYLDDVLDRVRKATTRELPGYFPFQVLQDLVSCFTHEWDAPARSLIDTVHQVVITYQNALIEKYFGAYVEGGLYHTVSNIMQEYMQKCREESLQRVNWLLELESKAFTLNKHLLDNYREQFLRLYKHQYSAMMLAPEADFDTPSFDSRQWNPHESALAIMATVRAYFQIAYKRVVDMVPLAVDRELVRVQKRAVQEELSVGLNVTGPEASERCQKLLAEPADLVSRREELENRLARLSAAQRELSAI